VSWLEMVLGDLRWMSIPGVPMPDTRYSGREMLAVRLSRSVEAFLGGLREAGFVDGHNVAIEVS
jgi:hypothetical protein